MMNDERLAELEKEYADRNLMEELSWAVYANHGGYVSKEHGEFINWLVLKAYHELKQAQRTGKWIPDKTGNSYWICTKCGFPSEDSGAFALYHYCPQCGAKMEDE